MKKLLSVLALVCFVSSIPVKSFAESDGDFVEIKHGEKAPYDGFLFDSDGLANLVAKQETEKETLKLEHKTELESQKIILTTEINKKQTEIDINKKLSEDVLKLNKEEIDKLRTQVERSSWMTTAGFVGGFVVGTLVVLSAVKATIEMTK